MKNLNGKNALVTGTSSGIGQAVAILLYKQGANVGLHYNKNKLGIKDTIKTMVPHCMHYDTEYAIYKDDFSDDGFTPYIIERFVERFGSIDILINNAGMFFEKELDDLTVNDFEKINRVNAIVPFLLSKKAIQYMKENRFGRIINISSISAKYNGSKRTLHYAMSKSSLETMSKRLALEYATDGININVVRAGVIDTDLHEKVGRGKDALNERVNMIPMNRMGSVYDVARAVLYLVSESGDYITNTVLDISGGE